MKNTFLTVAYKGVYIHSNMNGSIEEVQTSLHGERQFKSHHAAKIAITKSQRV